MRAAAPRRRHARDGDRGHDRRELARTRAETLDRNLAERRRLARRPAGRERLRRQPPAEGPEQERYEAWVMRQVDAGVPLPGLYPPDAATRARYEAERGD